MALLFNDPLAFLPAANDNPAIANHNSGLRMLFQNWNHSSSSALGPPPLPVGTFNQPQQSAIQQQRQLDQLEEIKTRMENLQVTPNAPGSVIDRSIHSRRIRPTANESSSNSQQMLEPIPVMDLDHPLNSWMLPNRKPEHLGPMASKNNSDWPILPRFTVSALSNGTLVQIPVSPPSIVFYQNISAAGQRGKKTK